MHNYWRRHVHSIFHKHYRLISCKAKRHFFYYRRWMNKTICVIVRAWGRSSWTLHFTFTFWKHRVTTIWGTRHRQPHSIPCGWKLGAIDIVTKNWSCRVQILNYSWYSICIVSITIVPKLTWWWTKWRHWIRGGEY